MGAYRTLWQAAPSAHAESMIAAARCVEDPSGMGLGYWLDRYGMRTHISDRDFRALSAEIDRLRKGRQTAGVGPGSTIVL